MDKEFAQSLLQQVMPSYAIGDLLGEGSSGAVFRIRDALKERAVKIVPLSATAVVKEGAVESAANRVERDFRHIVESYERLACDEIVTVYDFYKVTGGEDRRMATAYAIVVMEIYPENLHDYVIGHYEKEGGPLPVPLAQKAIGNLARMIEGLYTKRGFLFEDMKPENILVKELKGDVKLVVGDIGGLKSLGSVSTTGSQVTLSYCAPEILRRGKKPDLRSIIYSYGLISFFVLEGHLPYDHAGATERIDLIRQQGVPIKRRDLPPQVPEVIARCLAFDPSERFEDFHEIAEALEHGIPDRKDRFSGETVDLDSFQRRAGVASAPEAAPYSPPARTFGSGPTAAQTTAAWRPNLPPELSVGLRGSLQNTMQDQRRRFASVQVNDERQAMEKASREISGLVVRKGDVYKIAGDCRVLDDIVVEAEAILNVEGGRLFFFENAGILCNGTLRAKNATFTAADPVRRWKNVCLHPSPGRVNLFEGCTFRFGRGRTGGEIREGLGLSSGALNDGYLYGGGLFVFGEKEAGLTVQNGTFTRCSAQYGGGFFTIGAGPVLDTCLFESCTATLSGGGVYCQESGATIRNGRFFGCSAEKGGGGLGCAQSSCLVEGTLFDSCTTRFLFGGAIICTEASPTVQRCKFNRCTASKDGGAVWWDDASRPRLLQPAYIACGPTNTKTASR